MKKLLLLLPLLTACTTTFTHPTKSEQEFYADSSYCEAISQRFHPGGGYLPPGQITDKRRYTNCMYGKGWTVKQ